MDKNLDELKETGVDNSKLEEILKKEITPKTITALPADLHSQVKRKKHSWIH